MRKAIRVGLISDTHGLLRSEALDELHGADFIVHAGDIGHPDIIEQLARLAPLTAVRGNNDRGAWAQKLRDTEVLAAGAALIYVIHDLAELDLDPSVAGFRAVVSGHSHRPHITERDGVVYVNPGSAGPRRFALPVSIGHLSIAGTRVDPRLQRLAVRAAPEASVGRAPSRRSKPASCTRSRRSSG